MEGSVKRAEEREYKDGTGKIQQQMTSVQVGKMPAEQPPELPLQDRGAVILKPLGKLLPQCGHRADRQH